MIERLLKLFHQRKSLTLNELKETLNIKSTKEFTDLIRTLNALEEEKRIFNNHYSYTLITSKDFIGKVKDISKYEFAIINETGRIYVEKRNAKNVFDQDIVLAQKVGREYRVVHIYSHTIQLVTGRFIKGRKDLFFHSDMDFHKTFVVKNMKQFKISHNDRALVKIVKYEDPLVVEIVEIIGSANEKGTDITSILLENRARLKFPNKVIEDVKKVPSHVLESDLKGRVDHRDLLTVTIDGDDAKDFDDAISIEKKKNGYVLYVHIADVSHYVKENSPLDQEAYARCTSIYVVDRVVPMLPFELSNGICSLNPDVDRLTMTCKMEINSKGHCTSYDIYPSIIHSNKRCTYKKVNQFLESGLKEYETVAGLLNNLSKCARLLKNQSHNRGNIEFNTKEPVFELDKKGKTKAIHIREMGWAQQMIEESMILANTCVANALHTKEYPCMYRVHEKPDEERLMPLYLLCQSLHIPFLPDEVTSKDIQQLLESIEDEETFDVVSRVALHTMQKAKYDERCIGHFGLSLGEYCHFTSPIRRYSDLVVHRMIKKYLLNKGKELSKDVEKVHKQSIQMSQKERDAITIERKVNDYKRAEYMEKHLNEMFNATIVSVMEYGFFVELSNTVEGLVPARTLPSTNYRYDEKRSILSSPNGKEVYSIGKSVKVLCTEVNVEKGQVTFELMKTI